jgi:uncharacterized protein YjbI with pentapeptide repeats
MANHQHLNTLKRGVATWNKWRDTVHNIKPDLSDAVLPGVRLSDYSDNQGRWIAVNLRDADLSGVDFNRASLQYANLTNATLSGANLIGADLTGANLHGADFTAASLQATDFTSAKVIGTQFAGATFGHTVLADLWLGTAKGLTSIRHDAPSLIDVRTLFQSRALPPIFLRGCGVPERLIEYLPSVMNDPIQFYSCFISYSSADQDFAERLHADLQGRGVRCWFAPHDIEGGKKIHEQIDEAIRVHDKLLLVLSQHSMASEWVKTEISHARQKEITQGRQVLFPVSLVPFETIRTWKCFDADTGKDSAREIREYFIPDFSRWKAHDAYRIEFDRLMDDLRAKAATERSGS